MVPLPPIDPPPGTACKRSCALRRAARSTACIWASSSRTSASEGAPAATIASPAFAGAAADLRRAEFGAGKLRDSSGSATSTRCPLEEVLGDAARGAALALLAAVAPGAAAAVAARAPRRTCAGRDPPPAVRTSTSATAARPAAPVATSWTRLGRRLRPLGAGRGETVSATAARLAGIDWRAASKLRLSPRSEFGRWPAAGVPLRYPSPMLDEATAVDIHPANIARSVPIRPHLRLLHGLRKPANWLQLVRF